MRGLFITLLLVTHLSNACYGGDQAESGDITGAAVTVALETDLGTILVEVYPDAAPLSAGDKAFYDNCPPSPARRRHFGPVGQPP